MPASLPIADVPAPARPSQDAASDGADFATNARVVEDSLLDSVLWICSHHGLPRSAAALCAGLPKTRVLTPAQAVLALGNGGLVAGIVERKPQAISVHLLPVILLRKDRGACVLLGAATTASGESGFAVVQPEVSAAAVAMNADELNALEANHAILAKPRATVDARAGTPAPAAHGHWLWSTLWRYRRYYLSAGAGAILINVLALASTFFTMNVYDRVVPNQAFVTLWSLAIGVAIAMLFEFVARHVRAHLLDMAGKKADLVLGAALFRQALSVQMEHKPASAGAFANQLREFESVRDFATSATLAALSDLPFTFLFVGVIFMIGGPLGWVPLLTVPLVVGASVLIQWPLARTMRENLRESSLKQGVLIESIEGLEDLKATGGQRLMQSRWESCSALTAATAMKARALSSLAMQFVSTLQQFETVVMVVWGVYLIQDGQLTQGALIGAVMLAGRALAPLSQVTSLAVRFQQAKAAMANLNRLMAMPVDREPGRDYLSLPEITGRLLLRDVSFAYPAPPNQTPHPVLEGIALAIEPAERVAILGRVGSGKSTLLRLMAQLYRPVKGQIFVDGIDLSQIDPADWRQHVGYVGQDSRLFYGSLRDNVMLGRPEATAHELMRVLRLTGLDAIAERHPLGLNLPVGESGQALSGGQRQLVALARTLLARPRLLLLDEPTSAMDNQTEAQFLQRLEHETRGQTLVIVTHRPSILQLVDRIVVVDEGRVVADGPMAQVLAVLNANSHAKGHSTADAAPTSKPTLSIHSSRLAAAPPTPTPTPSSMARAP